MRAFVTRRLAPALMAFGLSIGAACAMPGQLVASDGSHRLVARDDATGLTVVLTTEAWPGDAWSVEDLTVVHVLVSNLSSQPILLAPGDFELIDSRGFVYTLRDTGARFRREGQADAGYDPGRGDNFLGIYGSDLASKALPWGVLAPGTQMRGFLYFDNLTNRANHAELIWHAQNPMHQSVADFTFPLSVAREPVR